MYEMNVIVYIESLIIAFGILGLCVLFTIYGLSGKLKDHIDLIFKKKKEKGINSGAKFG